MNTEIEGGKNNNKENDANANIKTDGNASKGKDANGKCVGEVSCAGTSAAAKFSTPAQMMDDAKKKLDESVKNGMKTIATTLTNPAKCATLAVGVVPAMIDGIGKSISGAFDNITASIEKTLKAVDDKGIDTLFVPFQIAHAMFIGKLQNVINKIALGADADKILSDPKLTAKVLFDKIVLRSNLYKMAIKDAKFRGVFKEWFGGYINTLLDTLKIAQPEVDRINGEVKKIIEGMGDNIGTSLGHAITNVIASTISALPLVGGVVGAIKSADQLGQEIINACKPPIAKGAGIIMPMVNGFNKQKSRLKCKVGELEEKVKPIIENLEKKLQVGGVGYNNNRSISRLNNTKKNVHKNISNTTKRINVLLKQFTNKQVHKKINYTRRLLYRRH